MPRFLVEFDGTEAEYKALLREEPFRVPTVGSVMDHILGMPALERGIIVGGLSESRVKKETQKLGAIHREALSAAVKKAQGGPGVKADPQPQKKGEKAAGKKGPKSDQQKELDQANADLQRLQKDARSFYQSFKGDDANVIREMYDAIEANSGRLKRYQADPSAGVKPKPFDRKVFLERLSDANRSAALDANETVAKKLAHIHSIRDRMAAATRTDGLQAHGKGESSSDAKKSEG